MPEPRTAKELARELSPLLEALANLRYLFDHHPSYRVSLKQYESDAFERLLGLVSKALVD